MMFSPNINPLQEAWAIILTAGLACIGVMLLFAVL